MANYEVNDIRNLVLLGHGSSGKTTLADAILFKTKTTKRLGCVDEGTSVLDKEADEIEKKISIDSAIVRFDWKDKEINLIDTPGYPDFIAQVIGSMVAADIALIEISATNGIEINTRKLWKMASDRGLCRAIVITKMDGDNINLDALLTSITETLGKECIPINFPKEHGPEFSSVVSVLDAKEDDIDKDIICDINAVKENLIETAISVDDELTEKYLDGAKIEDDKVDECLSIAMAEGNVVPILFCSAKKGVGITELLDVIAVDFPSPAKTHKAGFKDSESGEVSEIEAKKDALFTAQVFKSVIDPFVGKLSFLRIFSGEINSDLHFHNISNQKKDKFSHIFKISGKDQKEVKSAIAGDIVAVTKIESLGISDTLCADDIDGVYPEIIYPTPMVSLALEPKSKGAEHKIGEALSKLASEDKTFKVTHDAETNELVITGISNLHLNVMLDRLKRRYEIEADTKPPKIPYKETITGKTDAKYKHKKQSGGHGQYGEVFIRIEPTKRGAGFNFKNSVVGGAIPGQYIPAVEKGIRETISKGVLCGYPMVDFQVDLFDGSFHNVDSSEAAFKIAGSKALHDAFNKAKPVLLEPVVNIEVVIPAEFMGEISGNLSGRRGRIMGMDSVADLQIVKASIPMAEVANYESELKSITGGQGSYTMEFSHYEIVPSHIASSVISKSKPVEKEDEK